MHFDSYLFFLFLLIVLPIYYWIRNLAIKKMFILVCSLVFYSVWDVRFVFLIFASTAIDLFAGRKILANKSPKFYLILSLAINLLILFFFKYFNFATGEIRSFLLGRGIYWSPIDVPLPIGLSFYTFQAMSFTIDCYRRQITQVPSRLDFFTYITFFPHLVAGPIVRGASFLPQLRTFQTFDWKNLNFGFYRISIGLMKKLVISSYFAQISDSLFLRSSLLSSFDVLLAGITFGMQIYFDFSAYSDIAIGTARLFGYEFHENFNFPYAAQNPSDFWKRWHISLSSWLRDYLYIPLGGSRGPVTKKYINSLITMLLGGLWHGANWTFLIWGFIHGIYLNIFYFIGGSKKDEVNVSSEGINFIKCLVFFFLISISWLPFRAENFTMLSVLISQFCKASFFTENSINYFYFLSALILGPIFQFFAVRINFIERIEARPRLIILTAFLALLITYFFHGDGREFIYFQF